ncbi:MAG TPA: NnrS family protein [Bryobacteraceae bacterium]|nr:NnrS family protein [Bryobacteraceae bacterium]
MVSRPEHRHPLPALWAEAFRRDSEQPIVLADPLPERRLARLLAAFIAGGLFFLVAPGTLLGVWNLIDISSRHSAGSVSPVWIQSHGHAQLFGWVASFMIGISLYTVPKFRGGALRSLRVGWAMWALWTGAVGARWCAALLEWHWRTIWPLASAAELTVALLLIWQCAVPARSTGLWNRLVFAGFGGLVLTLAWQLAVILPLIAEPLIPAGPNHVLLWLALWAFAFPVAWGFSVRFLPSFLGLPKPKPRAATCGLVLLAAAAASIASQPAGGLFLVASVLAACWSISIFQPAPRSAKLAGVDPRYPWFVRASFAWLVTAAVLALAGNSAGWIGASRHAFTVGFLATLIFSIGPRILPSFLNSRELWSKRLMLAALLLISAGCLLRVTCEPLAYGGIAPWAWNVLPVSATLELAAVMAFAINIAMTLAAPLPAWIEASSVTAALPLYWYISAYPGTRALLQRAGLHTLAHVRQVPRSLTLREAALADQADEEQLLALLREYFEKRLARTLREKRLPC